MGMAGKKIEYEVWEEKVSGTHVDAKKRGINSRTDWRNPDVLVKLDGARVEVRDEAYRAHQGPNEPDWDKGWYIWRQGPDTMGQTRELFSGVGQPPEWVRQAHMNGL